MRISEQHQRRWEQWPMQWAMLLTMEIQEKRLSRKTSLSPGSQESRLGQISECKRVRVWQETSALQKHRITLSLRRKMLLKCSIIWSSNGFRDMNKHYSIVLYWGEIQKEKWYQNKYNTLKCLLFSRGETVTSNSWMLALHCIKSKQPTNPHTQELPAISLLSQICSSQEDLDCPESSVPQSRSVRQQVPVTRDQIQTHPIFYKKQNSSLNLVKFSNNNEN